MSDLPISQLPALTALTSDAQFPVEQGGTTYRVAAGFASSGNLHGAFHSELTQSATTADTALIMSAETTDFSVGVNVVNNTKITVSSGGTYNLQFSFLFHYYM